MPPLPQPFTIDVPEAVLEDLRQRLARTRWPDEIPHSGWQYGTNLAYLQALVAYWQHTYDWRAQERLLNRFPQYRVQLGDVTLHFIHQPGQGPAPLPLLLLHGWPSSVYEFLSVIEPLTNPAAHGGDAADAFSVVVPSLPGYAFSHVPHQRRLDLEEMAALLQRLMVEVLGYSRFAAHGGDWGAFLAARLGYAYPEHLLGIHLTMVPVAPHPSERTDLSPAEAAFLKEAEAFRREEAGYQWIQGTKPQTLAYALTDSPVGLAAWITEKFYAWTDCGGDLERRVSKDALLTTIMLYWVTQSINSSFWLYYQLYHHPWRLGRGERIAVPTAVAAFPREILRPPREWAARVCNLQRWTPMPAGGHFAALEEPAALVADLRAFFRTLRSGGAPP
ncbi:MAG: multidrug MFS transporter [Candidatus Tectimicrobiota bacterium]|nr:MAG: multidrug MFS transporter [Candidatus Tectomicrobia bacterium]